MTTSTYHDVHNNVKITQNFNQSLPVKNSQKDTGLIKSNMANRYLHRGIPDDRDKRIAYVKLNSISNNEEPQDLKRLLNKQGLSPVHIKYNKNPITHENTGTGLMIMDLGNQDRINRTKQNLEKFGYKPQEVPSFNHMLK